MSDVDSDLQRLRHERISGIVYEALRLLEDEHRAAQAVELLVDAAGLLSREHPDVIGTAEEPTSRGYYVAHREDSE